MITPVEISKKANRQWSVTTEPAIEPITLDELKLFARIDGEYENDLLDSFIESARISMEDYLGRAMISQTIKMRMDWWPGTMVELPKPPLISITKVETLDEDDTSTEYSSSNYYAVTESIPGKLVLKDGVSEPENVDRLYGGFRIEYKAGYGTAATDVPNQLRNALKLWATAIYENRALGGEPPPSAVPILNLYKIPRI